jgi:DNA mismatch repair protein MutS
MENSTSVDSFLKSAPAHPSTVSAKEDATPLMRQYWDLKSQVGDALLFFRMGDFYELFGPDAVTAAEVLEITLTSRDKNKPNPLPMAGVPHHSVQGYIQRLLKAGKKIAIAEQVEDPDTVKAGKIVGREISRILTPGVQFDAEGSEANYLATAIRAENTQNWVLVCLDVSTGEVLASHPSPLSVLGNEFQKLPIRHFLRQTSDIDPRTLGLPDTLLVEDLPKNYLSIEQASQLLKSHYEIENLETFLGSRSGILALGVLLTYTLRTQQQERLAHLQIPVPLQQPKTLVLGPNTAQNLDLGDLFPLINQTHSTLGSRQLKRWLLAPLKNSDEIAKRQAAVIELSEQKPQWNEKINSSLRKIYDLERICGRINTRLANPRDTLALGQTLLSLQEIAKSLSQFQSPAMTLISQRSQNLAQRLSSLAEKMVRIQKDPPPISTKDGGIFQKGTTSELDHLISLTEDGQRWLMDLETRERESTGISSLKVRYNRVFGYYIEITQTHLKSVPSHYQRKQTMVGAERFFTEELKKFEEEILTASTRLKSMELDLFEQLIHEIQQQTPSIMEAARVLGEFDSLVALSQLAQKPGWCFPKIDESRALHIEAGRHAIVDQAKKGHFVPNDLHLSPDTRLTLLITGPNMGGKSTVMRQTALIVILGQMGAPVPARSAQWGVFSSVYTRIGAQDAIARGQSTFMVEMSELAHILHYADDQSLLILDEIGRGTSTYDGMSVAWATLEWMSQQIGARTLFATHYHELIHLSEILPRLANAHLAVENEKSRTTQSLRFLYELKEGPTNESFGIQVAQMAGLPKTVIDRAWGILGDLESNKNSNGNSDGASQPAAESVSQSPRQLSLFDTPAPTPSPVVHPLLSELQELNLNEMTPIQAWTFLNDAQKSISKK